MKRLDIRPAGFHSHTAAVADLGKYQHCYQQEPVMALTDEFETATIGAALQACIVAGRRILTVGCPPGTFDDRLQRNPFLMFWPSSEASARDAFRTVPPEVGAVLVTTMLSFELSRNVRQQARARDLVCPKATYSPGHVKRTLAELWFTESRSDPMPEKAAATPKLVASPPAVKAAPVPPSDPGDGADLLRMVDDAIANLQLIRELQTALIASIADSKKDAQSFRAMKDILTRV